MELSTALYVTAGVLGVVSLLLFVMVMSLCCRVSSMSRRLQDLNNFKIRVQKLKLEDNGQYAYNNPTLTPDEELTKRGYTMYMGPRRSDDVESGRGPLERQKGGQFVEELTREIDNRQNRKSSASVPPPFLLQAIEENKRKSRTLQNPVASNGRTSETNPNFIY